MKPVATRTALAVLVLMLATVAVAEASVSPFWRPLGTSASGNGVSQTPSPRMVFDAALAVGSDGRPVVAYTEHASAVAVQGAITVKRWTGSAWQTLSGATGLGQGYQPQVRVSASGAIHVAWLRSDGAGNIEVRMRVRSGATFEPLGGSDSPGGVSGANPGITAPLSLALDAAGHPVVAFLAAARTGITGVSATPAVIEDTTQVYVRRWTGSAWEFVGSDLTGGGASNAVSFVGAPGSVLHAADAPALAIDSNGDPVVAFTYLTAVGGVASVNTDIYVTRWDGVSWIPVGPAVPPGASPAGNGQAGGVSNSSAGSSSPSLAPGAAGRLALAWEEGTPPGTTYVWVRVWNGVDAWEQLAGSATGAGFAQPGTVNTLPQIAVDPDGHPIVAWQALVDPTGPAQIFVLRWNGVGAWEEHGFDSAADDGVSDAGVGALAPVLALTPPGGPAEAGAPTVAWLDGRLTGSAQVFLRQFFTGATVPLTVTLIGDGQVTSDPGGVACTTGTCVTELPVGTVVRLVPEGGPATVFGAWTGACSGAAGCTVTLTAARSVTASFVAAATLTVAVPGEGGRVSSSPVGIAGCTDDCSAKFTIGRTVTLTATVDAGGIFDGWGGACAWRGTSTTCAVTLGADTSVTATFRLRQYALSVTAATPAGALGQNAVGSIGGPLVACAFGAGACATTLSHGTRVVLVATPAAGNRFLSWTGGPCNGRTSATCEFTLTANASTTALFRGITGLHALKAGNGAGTISGTGFACGTDCFEEVFTGTSRALTATPTAGSRFLGWSGDACDGQPSGACTVVAAGLDQSVTATFQLTRHSLTVINRPGGTVVSLPPLPGGTIDCGSGSTTCAGVLDYGTPVTLQATPNAGFVFVSWAGVACAGGATGPTCAFSLRANVTVTPTFRARTLVTVVKEGNGAGTVSAPGIACGADCAEAVFDARTVSLTATPAVGSRFVGFGGACVSATSPCTFVPSGNNQTVTATFQRIAYTVTVANRPNGEVTALNGLPDPVTCGAGQSDCTATLDHGTAVVLRATPIPGTRFVNWTGTVCHGRTNTTCEFTVPAASVALAPNYRDITTLSLNKSGLGGTVTSSPAGISCGPTCAAAAFDFARGAAVRLTATPTTGWSFNGFSGDCTGASCLVNASGPTAAVGATFTIQSRRLRVTIVGNGSVGGAGFACDASTTPCAQDFDYGTTLPLTPVPDAGYRFTGWTEGCTGANPTTCRPLLTVDRSVTATFRPIFTLDVARTGNSNSGAITSSPAGISCGVTTADCTEVYLGGTRVTLTRSAPITGTDFRWLGDCAFRGTSSTCAVTMDADVSVVGEYRLRPLELVVNRVGPQYGTVTRVGGTLDCGAACSEVIDYGTLVTLRAEASASPASEFVSWAGCTPATSPSCTFPLTAPRTVTATFRPLVSRLTLQALSTGPLGIGAVRQITAVATFTDGTQQDVTAHTTTTTWTAAPTIVATVSPTGLVTGRTRGTASVQATFRRGAQTVVSDPLAVEVDALVADTASTRAIAVTCAPYGDASGDVNRLACLPSGLSFEVHCRATGRFVANPDVEVDITDQVTWVTTSAAIARPTGLVAFQGPDIRQSFRIAGAGIARLYARQGARTSLSTGTPAVDPWAVQGVALTVAGAPAIEPASPSVAVGSQQQLQAVASFNPTAACPAPPPRDFSLLVDWSSTDESVAEVSFFGAVTGVAAGSVTIGATYGTMLPDTVPLRVNP